MKKLDGILLIDDDETNNFLNQRLFARLGLSSKVKVLPNGNQAFNYLYNISRNNYDLQSPDYFRPDLILLDVNMPVMDGFEFMDLYEKLDNDFRNRIVLALLSTSSHPLDIEKSKKYRIEYLTKPLTAEKMTSLISRHFPEENQSITNS